MYAARPIGRFRAEHADGDHYPRSHAGYAPFVPAATGVKCENIPQSLRVRPSVLAPAPWCATPNRVVQQVQTDQYRSSDFLAIDPEGSLRTSPGRSAIMPKDRLQLGPAGQTAQPASRTPPGGQRGRSAGHSRPTASRNHSSAGRNHGDTRRNHRDAQRSHGDAGGWTPGERHARPARVQPRPMLTPRRIPWLPGQPPLRRRGPPAGRARSARSCRGRARPPPPRRSRPRRPASSRR